jgi:serine/threonine protein kinase
MQAPLTFADVKFDNIVIEYKMDPENQIHIQKVNLANIESAAKLEDGQHITGIRVGNVMWRSPETQAGIRIGKPSDVFSFGIVVSA